MGKWPERWIFSIRETKNTLIIFALGSIRFESSPWPHFEPYAISFSLSHDG